jgi:UDP-N-acetylmuramoyl-L-alanyl-D-glutamate--2,6-diaminopimelate ligase
VSATFWGHPAKALSVIGVTGTSGKTTVTHLVQAVLEFAGWPCDIVGTLSGARTTPEAPVLQSLLAASRDAGRRAVAVEVSSHGLELHRVDSTWFAVTAFTNLSQDHLDFHGSMESYFAAKSRLFTPRFTDRAVICLDDTWGARLAEQVAATAGVDGVTFSIADAGELGLHPGSATFTWRGRRVDLSLAGRFNVANALCAAEVAAVLGVDDAAIAAGLSAAPPVPGRFEPVDVGQPFGVLVDYSHKPDALDKALRAARELVGPTGRLAVVFGCGGDRDPAKRPVMAELASRLADSVVITTDNPRSEDPTDIIDQVAAGVPPGVTVTIEPDRQRAIAGAVARAGAGDVVLLAGKGHETTQVFADRVEPFDDREVAAAALAEAGHAAGGSDR